MTISGKNLIAGKYSGDFHQSFYSFNVINQQFSEQKFTETTEQELNTAVCCGHQAFEQYSQLHPCKRADFLREIAKQLIELGDALIHVACTETGLPEQRIVGERQRTVNQLLMFATHLEKQEYQPIFDDADASRQPLPKPDLRLGYIPLGVVAVFGASNFPLAFSTAGGDTASALAAGCTVVMKAHSAHPGTSELVASAINEAALACNIDAGVFSLLQGENYDIAQQLVQHPLIKAVGFTGSERVGMILRNYVNQRSDIIPFYGELGSINPQFILQNKLSTDAVALAQQLVNSMMMGIGQFCTSPGLWVLEKSNAQQAFFDAVATELAKQPAGLMLTPQILIAYREQVQTWREIQGVTLIGQGQLGTPHEANGVVFSCDLSTFIQHPQLQQEVFGPCALMVTCDDIAQIQQLITVLRGNLTASIHAIDEDTATVNQLLPTIIHKVGRIIFNQMPTGVEVCAAMNHGGPFPASTDIRTTSVGLEAIKRFQRPICYQNFPQQFLPTLLQD